MTEADKSEEASSVSVEEYIAGLKKSHEKPRSRKISLITPPNDFFKNQNEVELLNTNDICREHRMGFDKAEREAGFQKNEEHKMRCPHVGLETSISVVKVEPGERVPLTNDITLLILLSGKASIEHDQGRHHPLLIDHQKFVGPISNRHILRADNNQLVFVKIGLNDMLGRKKRGTQEITLPNIVDLGQYLNSEGGSNKEPAISNTGGARKKWLVGPVGDFPAGFLGHIPHLALGIYCSRHALIDPTAYRHVYNSQGLLVLPTNESPHLPLIITTADPNMGVVERKELDSYSAWEGHPRMSYQKWIPPMTMVVFLHWYRDPDRYLKQKAGLTSGDGHATGKVLETTILRRKLKDEGFRFID